MTKRSAAATIILLALGGCSSEPRDAAYFEQHPEAVEAKLKECSQKSLPELLRDPECLAADEARRTLRRLEKERKAIKEARRLVEELPGEIEALEEEIRQLQSRGPGHAPVKRAQLEITLEAKRMQLRNAQELLSRARARGGK